MESAVTSFNEPLGKENCQYDGPCITLSGSLLVCHLTIKKT